MSTGNFPDLTPLLSPRSMAVIGAVPDLHRAGGRPIPFSAEGGFEGSLYPVNPRRPDIDGRPCYPSIAALPETPDLAVITVRSELANEAFRACAERGVPAVVMFTAGFREVGEAGANLEAELTRIAETHGTVLCGPNCIGVVNRHAGLMASFASSLQGSSTPPGPVGFVTQSGMFLSLAIVEQIQRKLGVGKLVSVGNEAGIEVADVIAHYADDPAVSVIGSYLEGARDGRKLARALGRARAAGKRVVVLKVGRTEDSARAAASHTGSFAGDYRLYRSIFEAHGVIEADGLEEFFDLIETATRAPRVALTPTRVPRVAVFGNSGGLGVLAADKLRQSGLALAEFSASTREALRAHLPPFIHPVNPIDLALQALEEQHLLPRYLDALVSDPEVDGVLAIFGLYRPKSNEFADAILAAASESGKPFVFACPHTNADFMQRLADGGIPVFSTPERAIRAFRSLFLAPVEDDVRPPLPLEVVAHVSRLIAACREQHSVPAAAALDLVDALGIPVGRVGVAADADTAVRMASEASGPVALEVRIGLRRDPTFGPVVMASGDSRGAEDHDGAALMPAPVSVRQAERMLRPFCKAPVPKGAGSGTRCDVGGAARALAKLSALANAAPEITEIVIDPLLVRRDGEGVVAGDARVTLETDVSASR